MPLKKELNYKLDMSAAVRQLRGFFIAKLAFRCHLSLCVAYIEIIDYRKHLIK